MPRTPRSLKRDRDSSRKNLDSAKNWSGRFGRQFSNSSNNSNGDQEVDVNSDPGNHSAHGSTISRSYGPLQSQLDINHAAAGKMPTPRVDKNNTQSDSSLHSQPLMLPDRKNSDNESLRIDDDMGLLAATLQPSTSSDQAVLGLFSSAENLASPKANFHRPFPSINSRQISSPTSYPQTPRDSACENPKDKDDAYGAWWFLASISDSFDSLHSHIGANRNPQHLKLKTQSHAANKSPRELVEKEAERRPPSHGDAKEFYTQSSYHTGTDELSKIDNLMYELSSQKHSDPETSSQKKLAQPIQELNLQHTPPEKLTGGDYIAKEQKLRQEWIKHKRNTLGGTLNYDQNTVTNGNSTESSTTPYHYISPQHASILPNTGSNLDTNMAGKRRPVDNIDWTPQDSSYGAAVQACGWIPKRIRKLLEGFFVVLILGLLIFVVVKTGIKLKSSGTGGGSDIYFDDDDHYLAWNDDGGNGGSASESSDGNDSNDASNDESNDASNDRLRYR